ncbi:taste receptor type 2 member 9-like [Bufo gargarizans]|uniref:taste receptor type 2 member 9-like n=1 Tax=Bufo gargarizans TaxID=30331 RepID=UPI001CF39C90|nr:taste receptor type 2 member 9-like [Bufo gargarizans]
MIGVVGVVSLAALGFTACISLNLSVVIIYLKDWMNGQRLSALDQILLSTTLTSITLQLSISFDAVLYFARMYAVFSDFVYLCNVALFFYLLELHFWQTALLSVYYCVKLVNVSHCFSSWLKTKMLTSPNQLVLALDIALFLLALPLIWSIQISNLKDPTRNSSVSGYMVSLHSIYDVFSMTIGCIVPFTITFTCIVLSVRSVISHVWRIRQNASGFSFSPQIRAHVRASTTMLLSEAVNLSLIFNVLVLFQTTVIAGTILHFIYWFIFMVHPTIQVIVLITGNSKLKSRLQIKCQ